MYAQQVASTRTQTEDSSSSSSTGTRVSSQSDQASAGNLAALQESGLEQPSTDSTQEDSSFMAALQTMGCLVLDCMPISLALHTASQYLHVDAVADWVNGLDECKVGADLDEDANQLLSSLWPQGTGFVMEGALGGVLGLGADLEGTIQVIRSGPNTIQGTFGDSAELGLLGAGAGALLKDAFGETAAGAMVSSGAALRCSADGQLETRLDLGSLLTSGALLLVQNLSSALGPATGGLSIAGSGMIDQLAGDPWDLSYQADLVGKASGSAALSLEDATAPVLSKAIRALGDSDLVGPIFTALAKLSSTANLGVQAGDEGFGIHGSGGLRTLTSLAAQLPLINDIPGLADLDALDHQLAAGEEQGYEIEFFIGLVQGQSGDSSGGGDSGLSLGNSWIRRTNVDSATNTTTGAKAQVNTATTMSIQAFVAGLSDVDTDGVSSILVDAGNAVSQDISVPLEDNALDQHFPNWAEQAAGALSLAPGAQVDSQLSLEGSITASAATLTMLSQAGITPPAGWNGCATLDAVGQSLISLRCGGDLTASWLAPWRAQLQAASAFVRVQQARAVGTLRGGIGGAASLALEGSASAEGRLNTGVAIDMPLTETQSDLLATSRLQAQPQRGA